jgi:NAD(P)-dependent dehydrogenase (short-subunit alcohol dehydrogenase family)
VEPTIQQLFDLTGKTVVISGASGYLGSAMSRALAEAGARVVATSRDAERAQQAADKLPGTDTTEHLGMALDHMKDEETITAQFEAIRQRVGHVDVLVNNGHEGLGADWTSVTGEQFSNHLRNATGYFVLARLMHQHAVARQAPASVIMIGSMYGQVGSYPEAYEGICAASPAAYHTLKGGIIHMTRHLAVYWARDNVRVNCLSPGPFPHAGVPEGLVERLETKCPMGRMGRPEELKGAIVFLASSASSYMTGQNMTIDGGWTAW